MRPVILSPMENVVPVSPAGAAVRVLPAGGRAAFSLLAIGGSRDHHGINTLCQAMEAVITIRVGLCGCHDRSARILQRHRDAGNARLASEMAVTIQRKSVVWGKRGAPARRSS